MAVLEVNNLQTQFRVGGDVVKAVDGVSFSLEAGKTLAIVGESGCGKSMTALSLLRLIPSPPGEIVGGDVVLERDGGHDNLRALSPDAMRKIRGYDIAMIFQEPMTALNPVMRIADQIAEVILEHETVTAAEVESRVVSLLEEVGIPEPARRAQDYPHALSGGMRQRVMIAMALACRPRVLIADEPTTALDVTIQAQVLHLLQKLQRERNMAVLLITHDLGVVAQIADEVAVMYAGRIVEQAPVRELFAHPRHPYTQGLLGAMPTFTHSTEDRLATIPGRVPSLADLPVGCAFADRCKKADDNCRAAMPELETATEQHRVRCVHAQQY